MPTARSAAAAAASSDDVEGLLDIGRRCFSMFLKILISLLDSTLFEKKSKTKPKNARLQGVRRRSWRRWRLCGEEVPQQQLLLLVLLEGRAARSSAPDAEESEHCVEFDAAFVVVDTNAIESTSSAAAPDSASDRARVARWQQDAGIELFFVFVNSFAESTRPFFFVVVGVPPGRKRRRRRWRATVRIFFFHSSLFPPPFPRERETNPLVVTTTVAITAWSSSTGPPSSTAATSPSERGAQAAARN